MDTDQAGIIVLGAGLAGTCAALAAAEAGERVLLAEKQPQPGGSTVLSGGFFAFAGTPLQARHGIADSPDLLFDDLCSVGGGAADPALLRAYADGQAGLHDWLAGHGAGFAALELSAGQSVPRSHQADMATVMAGLHARLRDRQVSIRTGVSATRLRQDRGGRICGVVLEDTDGPHEHRADAVILATGGFSRSADLLANFAPAQAGAMRLGGEGCTGDGLRMAWALGAGMRDMGQVKGTFGNHPGGGTERHAILLYFYKGAIIVNRAGRRFVDESLSYKLLGDACLQQPGRTAFQVFDQEAADRSDAGVPLFDLAPALADGTLLHADSLDELAALCGMPADELRHTVTEYNAGVDTGRDPAFGRDGLCNHAGALVRIERPPFYAYPSSSVVLATYCGLTTTPQAEVVDVFGGVIPGLYAAGEIMGGFHGAAYMTGSSLGKAAFFGRVAGQQAAGVSRARRTPTRPSPGRPRPPAPVPASPHLASHSTRLG